jgi:hypothetical protein
MPLAPLWIPSVAPYAPDPFLGDAAGAPAPEHWTAQERPQSPMQESAQM